MITFYQPTEKEINEAAILAILEFEERIDPIGYDISYYQEDLPNVVKQAILPWNN